MDVVQIKGLSVEATIGAFDWERNIRQQLIISAEMSTDIARAAASDSADQLTVDYSKIAQRIQSFVAASEFHLLEALAEQLSALIRNEFAVSWVRLTIEKPRPDSGFTAALIIER